MRNAGAIIFKLQRDTFTRNVTENAKLFIPHHLLICKMRLTMNVQFQTTNITFILLFKG